MFVYFFGKFKEENVFFGFRYLFYFGDLKLNYNVGCYVIFKMGLLFIFFFTENCVWVLRGCFVKGFRLEVL